MSCKIEEYRKSNGVIVPKVTLTRGDSFIAKVTALRKESGEEYQPQAGDVVRFALKRPEMTAEQKEYVDSEPRILKTIPNDTLLLELQPDDTKPLPFGQYVYDIELTYASGRVDTFIEAAPFVIAQEVH